jgi:hypothetical protein
MPITIQPISARMTGPASFRSAGSSLNTGNVKMQDAKCEMECKMDSPVCILHFELCIT